MSLSATTYDTDGNEINLSGESLMDLARELTEYAEPFAKFKVYDEPGFVRGWICGDGSWGSL